MGDRLGDRNKSVVLIGLLENFLQCGTSFSMRNYRPKFIAMFSVIGNTVCMIVPVVHFG